MPKVIKIRTTGELRHAIRSLDRIRKRLPQLSRLGMRRWGKILVRDLKQSAMDAGIKPSTGTLFEEGIRWEQSKRGNQGGLFMRLYGIYLDSMRTHWVNVHGGGGRVRIMRWARRARSQSIRIKASLVDTGKLDVFFVRVRKHPFIKSGYARARPKLRAVLKRVAKRAVDEF